MNSRYGQRKVLEPLAIEHQKMDTQFLDNLKLIIVWVTCSILASAFCVASYVGGVMLGLYFY